MLIVITIKCRVVWLWSPNHSRLDLKKSNFVEYVAFCILPTVFSVFSMCLVNEKKWKFVGNFIGKIGIVHMWYYIMDMLELKFKHIYGFHNSLCLGSSAKKVCSLLTVFNIPPHFGCIVHQVTLSPSIWVSFVCVSVQGTDMQQKDVNLYIHPYPHYLSWEATTFGVQICMSYVFIMLNWTKSVCGLWLKKAFQLT